MDMTNANPQLMAALATAQAEIENATKGSVNPAFRSRYADLAEILNTCRPVLAKHSICIMQSTGFDGATVSVCTVLAHKDGGWVSSTASCVPAKTDAQGIGASTTYLRRYSLAAMCAVAQEDDDGNSAQHAGKPAPVSAKPTIDRYLDARQALRDAGSLSELGAIWRDLSADARKVLADEKDAAKTRLNASGEAQEVTK
jgi:hypothetical protein